MAESTSAISRAFDRVWRGVVVVYRIALILSLLLMFSVVWMALRGTRPLPIEHNVALVLAPAGVLVEQVEDDPGQRLIENLSGEGPSRSGLRELVEALEMAREDDRIRFAVLKLDGLWSAGLAQLDELREAMRAFQASGKKIVAWGPWYDQMHYYAAAQADEVVLDPYGVVYVEGFSLYNNYYREALEKIGVNINVFRVGEYKSAVEPFTRDDMSAEARAANLHWLGDLWSDYGRAVASGRGLELGAADEYVKGMRAGMVAARGDAAVYARERSFVTHVETRDEFRKRMAEIVGVDQSHGSFRQMYYRDYLNSVRYERRKPGLAREGTVALVVVEGELVDGPGGYGQAGGDTISDLLDEVRRDDQVSAVVLRIDSPGGSVWASEQIRRAVQALRAEGKPVVASMSSVAASGGYWVAMDADQIWAHETTITGSIGVFGLVPTLDRTLGKLGVHTDGVGTTELAGAFRLDRPLAPEAGAIIQVGIEKVYRDFIEGVATGRKLPVERVEEIARGRVWSGRAAREMGLIDQFGGLKQAADAAAELAGLDVQRYQLDERAPARGFTSMLLSRFFGQVRVGWVPGMSGWIERLRTHTDLQRLLRVFNDPRGVYSHCFCVLAEGARGR